MEVQAQERVRLLERRDVTDDLLADLPVRQGEEPAQIARAFETSSLGQERARDRLVLREQRRVDRNGSRVGGCETLCAFLLPLNRGGRGGRPIALLDDVRELVCEQLDAAPGARLKCARLEKDVASRGERPRAHLARELGGAGARVNSHVAEIATEAGLERRPERARKRRSARALCGEKATLKIAARLRTVRGRRRCSRRGSRRAAVRE